MSPRKMKGDHTLLRIFIGESDMFGLKLLYLEVLERARQQGLAGCTVLRGIAGYGASSVIHTDNAFKLSSDLPIIIEIVDTSEHVEKFIKDVDLLLERGLVTKEMVNVHHYLHGKKN